MDKTSGARRADPQRPSTWVRYRGRLCRSCEGTCCRLEVEVDVDDLVRMGLVDEFERDVPPHRLAKQLARQGVVDRYSPATGKFILSRMANEDCVFLDGTTRLCTIYERRPQTCRDHPRIGPRPGFCAYRLKQE
ncbi:MAG: YkgJ family cysteine cluster protein [Deltaproteobacteria bacterium]|nr:MAG: YkgJ family cysteine cluster protein [Deltaproteobacteria bacterium]